MDLHSTIFKLKPKIEKQKEIKEQNLHSTIFKLKLAKVDNAIGRNIIFTFYYI